MIIEQCGFFSRHKLTIDWQVYARKGQKRDSEYDRKQTFHDTLHNDVTKLAHENSKK